MNTLLFTDIEGSTRLAAGSPTTFPFALARHFEVLRGALEIHGAHEFQEAGDGLLIAFPDPTSACAFAVDVQRRLAAVAWPDESCVPRVRMAFHRGELEFRDGQYRGLAMNFVSRLVSAAHGGQVICSGAAAAGISGGGARLKSIGKYRLRGFERTEEIHEVVWTDQPPFPPLRASHARTAHLPERSSEFFGREEERSAVRALLDPAASVQRLVTLIGAGGIGKTRMAIEVGYDLLDAFDHAVFFVPLADVAPAYAIPEAIRRAVGIPPDTGKTANEQIREALESSGPALVVLDNLEHLLPDAGGAVLKLLGRIPQIRVLATSRIPLAVPGERCIAVPPLSCGADTDDSPGFRLFVESARTARPGFAPTLEDRKFITQICEKLEGIPLALELAAAQSSILSPKQILSELSEPPHRQADGNRPADTKSLERALEWSFESLATQTREMLKALSVFRGGWTLDAATTVAGAGDVGETRSALRNLCHSALVFVSDGVDGLRFRMLEPVREYASGLLGERTAEIGEKFEQYFVGQSYAAERTIYHAADPSRVDALMEDQPNYFRVLGTMADPYLRVRVATALHAPWKIAGRSRELRPFLRVGHLASGTPKTDRLLADALHACGVLDRELGHRARARICFHRAAILYRSLQLDRQSAVASSNLAMIEMEIGDPAVAADRFAKCAEVFKSLGMRKSVAAAITNQSACALIVNDLVASQKLTARALDLARDLGDPSAIAHALAIGSSHALKTGDQPGAWALAAESLSLLLDIREFSQLSHACLSLAISAGDAAAAPTVARLLVAANVLTERAHQKWNTFATVEIDALTRRFSNELGETYLADLKEEIDRMGMPGISAMLRTIIVDTPVDNCMLLE